MIKKKGAGVVMAIIIVSAASWTTFVSLVIKPNMWVGSVLCFFGGSMIGVAIALLMRRWWFKGIERKGG